MKSKHQRPPWLAFLGIVSLTAALWMTLFNYTDLVNVRVAAKAPAVARKTLPPAQHSANSQIQPASTPESTTAPEATEPALPPPVPVKVQRPAAAVAEQIAATSAPETESGLPPLTVMQNMRSVFQHYSARFGGNPTGNNAEITAVLNGRNPGHAMFLNDAEDGLRVNAQGQLIDNWGTPFFFHQISGTVMEIYSAGPDRKMWTSDDLMIK